MKKKFVKDKVVREFTIDGDKVIVTMHVAGVLVSNPTIEEIKEDGWQEYIEPTPPPIPPYIPSYAELVEQYISEHGYPTYGAELAISNNYAENPTEYAEAYNTYMQVRRDAKVWAEEQPHRKEAES